MPGGAELQMSDETMVHCSSADACLKPEGAHGASEPKCSMLMPHPRSQCQSLKAWGCGFSKAASVQCVPIEKEEDELLPLPQKS